MSALNPISRYATYCSIAGLSSECAHDADAQAAGLPQIDSVQFLTYIKIRLVVIVSILLLAIMWIFKLHWKTQCFRRKSKY